MTRYAIVHESPEGVDCIVMKNGKLEAILPFFHMDMVNEVAQDINNGGDYSYLTDVKDYRTYAWPDTWRHYASVKLDDPVDTVIMQAWAKEALEQHNA